MRSKHHFKTHILPPRSWGCPSSHRTTVLQHPWYQKLFFTQDAIFHTSVAFFQKRLGYKYCFVPMTTDAVSSPMGLGSDSDLVPIVFLGKKTHLADSMQFSLEYFLRIADGVPGVYYINTSFRGEDPDAMHLNQFYHVECELLGPFSEGIRVAETYVTNLVSTLLKDHKELVETVTGSTNHLVAFLEHHRSHDCKLPQITVGDALGLPIMDTTCWKYILASDPSRGRTITRAGELKLIEHFGGPVWLTEMDHLGVPFYQAFTDKTRQKARCADLLLGNGEVLGLGERHVSAEHVRAALRQHEIPPTGYAWYGEIREQKAILTTGWGMGVERFLAWVFQHDDIRDMAVIPRMKGLSFAP
ncbi:putative asparaginase like 1 [Xylaria grammica]|nr:putative asparaginase like 1 [Xylaria grammica]